MKILQNIKILLNCKDAAKKKLIKSIFFKITNFYFLAGTVRIPSICKGNFLLSVENAGKV